MLVIMQGILQSVSKLASGSQTLRVISRPTIVTLWFFGNRIRQGSRRTPFQSDKSEEMSDRVIFAK
jgi:hypothetical protein